MPIYDMSCPKCGQQATEYSEDKWQCLHCGNKFIYKTEPAASVNATTHVSIGPTALYDLEVGGPANNRPLLVPWLKVHKVEDDVEMARNLRTVNKLGCFAALVGVVLAVAASLGLQPLLASAFVLFTLASAYYAVAHTPVASARIRARMKYLRTLHVRGGTIVLCPYCHEKCFELRFGEEEPQRLTHCVACGKQFFLSGMNSYRIKMK